MPTPFPRQKAPGNSLKRAGDTFGAGCGYHGNEWIWMTKSSQLLISAVLTSAVASVVSTVALATLAQAEGKSAVRPANSTSHWLHGQRASRQEALDLEHTGVGLVTHHASALFWALPFEAWQALYPHRSSAEVVRDAIVMSAIAATVDYGLVPKRLTPGWEFVLSRKSMVGAFASLAAGLAAGALATRQLRRRLN
jgi:hypothetical protein